MRIGEMAARTGLTVATLRYYEREGLLRAPRWRAGQRCYDSADVSQIRLLKLARGMGFGIAELRALRASADGGDRRDRALVHRLAQIEADLARLAGQRDLLSRALNCRCAEPSQCLVLV